MLRISTIHRADEGIQFKLEGRLIGPWVGELRRLSDQALSQHKTVSLDLQKVWFVDLQGVDLLRYLAKKQVTQINCSPFVSQQLKEAAL